MTAPVEMLKVSETCERLKIGRATLYRLFDAKKLRRTKVGRSTRVSVAELERFIARQTR